ncbi:alpha/beta fold hydrolase [Ostreiculturibacter nitratireducens]|uniref:alpha/beta fold hydrolase n=1 Tax=Ostreiculturibacter nitratireducens TaxID=3075226 RepID=UPI0031B580A0
MAEPLLLIPGFMADARMFLPQVAALSAGRTIQVASLGEGDTIEDMAGEVLASAPPFFALAGHWIGGLVAMEILRRAPERVSRIAFLDVLTLTETPNAAAEREPRIAMARAGRLAEALEQEIPAAALAPGAGRADLQSRLREMAESLGPEAFARQSRALMRRPNQQKTFSNAMVQALVLCGAHDTLCPVRRHEFLAALMPRATLCVVEGAGHVPTLEQPEAVTDALRGWLSTPYLLRRTTRF